MQKKIIISIFILSFCFAKAFSSTNTDSLLNVLNNTKIDSLKIDLLNLLSNSCKDQDPQKSMEYAMQAKTMSEKINYHKGIANALHEIAGLEYDNGNYSAALNLFEKSLAMREKLGDKKNIAASHSRMAVVYWDKGNYPEALKHNYIALKMYDAIGAKTNIAGCYNNIGILYSEQNKPKEALPNYEKALALFKESNDQRGLQITYLNMGAAYDDLGNTAQAIENYSLSVQISTARNDKRSQANCYNNIGEIYARHNKFEQALYNYKEAHKLNTEVNNRRSLSFNSSNIGAVYLKQKKYKDAEHYLNEALALALEIDDKDNLIESYGKLAELDSARGNYASALQHYKLYINNRDSLFNENNTATLTETKMQYEFDKKQIADSLKFTTEKEITELKLQKQKAFSYIGLAGMIIISTLLFFVFRNYNKQKLANQQLKEAQEQLIKSERMATFGLLASRLSHEIQNPLNFVNNFSEISQELVEDLVAANSVEERKENSNILINNLKKINEHGIRASNIVKQLQDSSNYGTPEVFIG